MNFNDVIKKSVLEGFSYSGISATTVITTLLITFAISIYIFWVYKTITKSAFYFKNFNVSMSIISVVTAGILLAMQSSIVISLGMVGALSIVRFRTAIKDPLDLLFLFWSIGTGIICGSGLYGIAILMALIVTCGIVILDMLPVRMSPYLLIINCSTNDEEESIISIINAAGKYKIKSKNLTKTGMNLICEIRTKEEKDVLKKISELSSVTSVSLLLHDGEIKS